MFIDIHQFKECATYISIIPTYLIPLSAISKNSAKKRSDLAATWRIHDELRDIVDMCGKLVYQQTKRMHFYSISLIILQ